MTRIKSRKNSKNISKIKEFKQLVTSFYRHLSENLGYNLDEVGWYTGNSDSKTHPVGQKKPNAWGIYDMHGNVEEWCKDMIKGYPSFSVTDPIYCVDSVSCDRVIRGGSWNSITRNCRSANRQSGSPAFPIQYLGFRLALVPVD